MIPLWYQCKSLLFVFFLPLHHYCSYDTLWYLGERIVLFCLASSPLFLLWYLMIPYDTSAKGSSYFFLLLLHHYFYYDTLWYQGKVQVIYLRKRRRLGRGFRRDNAKRSMIKDWRCSQRRNNKKKDSFVGYLQCTLRRKKVYYFRSIPLSQSKTAFPQLFYSFSTAFLQLCYSFSTAWR